MGTGSENGTSTTIPCPTAFKPKLERWDAKINALEKKTAAGKAPADRLSGQTDGGSVQVGDVTGQSLDITITQLRGDVLHDVGVSADPITMAEFMQGSADVGF